MEKKIIPNDILLGEVTKLLSEGQEVIIMTKGNSMLPYLRSEKDSVALRKKEDIEVGNVVLAHLGDGRYVLHRIFSIDGNKITLMGDGNIRGKEYCTRSDISGTVVRFIKASGKEKVPCKGRIWRLFLPFRRILLAFHRRILRIY